MKNTKIIPASIISLIVTFMLLDLFFLYLSSSTFTGLYAEIIAKPSLNASVKDANNTGSQKNWNIDIIFDDDSNLITVNVKDADGKYVTGAQVKAKILRSVTTKEDRVIMLTEIEPGIYSGFCTDLNPGKWNIRVKVQIGELYSIKSKSIIIKSHQLEED